jgi:phosphoribosylformylglycinamidine cyclo-ligase
LVQGARPLFFLDYIAVDVLNAEHVATVVQSMAGACRAAGCAILGGETAEMPGVYRENTFDVAGTIVGVAQRGAMLPGAVAVGDAIIALPSSGLHTNGYSLARRLVDSIGGYAATPATLGGLTVGQALLAPHRSYLSEYTALQQAGIPVHAMAHITGGGVYDNLPRILPDGCGAHIQRGSWSIPAIFDLLVDAGNIQEHDAFHAFNMGLGMLIVLPQTAVTAALACIPEAHCVGTVVAGSGVTLV